MSRREPPRLPETAVVDPTRANEGRVPPHDLDAEAAVISAVLIDPAAYDKVADVLKAEHFYAERHRRIFEGCVELRATGAPVDIVQVGSWLKSRERLAQVGGMGYLTEVLNAAPAVLNVAAYGETIHAKWRARQIIQAAQRIAARGYGDYGEINDYADESEQAIYALARIEAKNALVPIREPLMESFRDAQDAAKRGAKFTGISTGFDRYDALTAGLHGGDLTIIGARPGLGKTSLALNIAVSVAAPRNVPDGDGGSRTAPGYGVAVFSLEMPRKQLTSRVLCSEARVDLQKMRGGHGGLTQNDWAMLSQVAGFVGGLPIWIDDTPALTLLDLRGKVRRMQAEYNRVDADGRPRRVGLVVIDYLQLMKGRDGAQSREQEVSEISRGLKALAKELDVPVIALAQLNRKCEERSDKRPQISDLRETGAIEQDADNIAFIYRDDYYTREKSEVPNVAELILAKQRNGPTGTAMLRFDHQYTRFDNLADGEYADEVGGEQ